ncbi:MAG TPA: S46 family peptidase [Polyangia bacterium]|nr:S46 family peptidase [Polyangia bacterium]
MNKARLLVALGILGAAIPARADEGMWTFNNFPKALVKQRYKADVTDAWLDHVRLASVRFNSGGSGSFVSPRGLVMTNHHVGADCIHKLDDKTHDYIKDGFYAATPAAEIKCPDLELNVLTGIEDVTAEVKSVEKPGMDDAAINKAQKEKMSALEKACNEKTKERCDVVTLYQGGVFNMYRYKKYIDVRLVFAPEFQIAFFGGDPDNFEYPRYDLDAAFFRVYEGDKELHPEHFLKWSAGGAKENELVFVSGNPGNTERLDTLAQLEFLRDFTYPMALKDLARFREVLKDYGKKGAEQERQARTELFYIENSLKALGGYLQGLQDKRLMGTKADEEAALRKRIAASPDKQKLYGGVWDSIAATQKKYQTFYKAYGYLEGRRGNPFWSDLFGIARTLVRAGDEKLKPSEKRLREYRDSNLQSVELRLFSAAPIYDGLEEATLATALGNLAGELGAASPVVKAALAGKTPEARAHELVSGTKLKDVALRKQLYGSKAALDASKDPMIVLARAIDAEARAIRKRYEDEVEGPVKQNMALLGKAQFEAEGLTHYPDATFTLRLSFGKVAGYTVDGKPIAPFTTLGGLYQRSAKAEGKAPWDLPARWASAKGKLKLETPMDFVSTNDIIGGNSGSPVINKAGELVGLIFDGNIQSLPGNFVYDDHLNRSVSVHSSALTEALRHVYDAGALADELSPKRRAER